VIFMRQAPVDFRSLQNTSARGTMPEARRFGSDLPNSAHGRTIMST
jgi:hypothetical protein